MLGAVASWPSVWHRGRVIGLLLVYPKGLQLWGSGDEETNILWQGPNSPLIITDYHQDTRLGVSIDSPLEVIRGVH